MNQPDPTVPPEDFAQVRAMIEAGEMPDNLLTEFGVVNVDAMDREATLCMYDMAMLALNDANSAALQEKWAMRFADMWFSR